jgi:hypothetical protein
MRNYKFIWLLSALLFISCASAVNHQKAMQFIESGITLVNNGELDRALKEYNNASDR